MTNIIKQAQHPIHYWWIFMFSGIALIGSGVYVARNPSVTYDELSIFFSAMLLISGICEASFCIENRRYFKGWGWFLTGAILDLILGLIFITNPILAAISLPLFAGVWLLMRSVLLIARSFQAKKKRLNDWPWLSLWAITGGFFSVVNIYNPLFSEDRLVIWTAFALLAVGAFYVHFGMLIKNAQWWINDKIYT
ncbi:HdeD family acid-resistance protein [Dyadobacter sp. Leaf189]|uniref:HdeD family acid-resistance protein n=1 Tax=Dyadobacter sp. Leaf189 TaxID=1736295 RepID=UPI0006FA83E5|nr:DUF308 domain-containing protein [Dyadobacter sp. Leaf189]KQS24662.1 hypothetical protein ASG33_23130 [Dyadobacter sp. Leaf189]